MQDNTFSLYATISLMTLPRVELSHTPEYQHMKKNFLVELKRASVGKPSSIVFLTHHLSEKPILTKGIVQGIVIGGTNYIISSEEIKPDGTRTILSKKKGKLPVFDTKQTLLDFFSKHVDPQAQAIGINFGFPLVAKTGAQGEIDGQLYRGTKEHTFKGVLHEPLGQLVKGLFKEKYHKNPKVSIANDTICLTLAGAGDEQGAFIAGTGFNMGLVLLENGKRTLVNLECGNFNKFTLSPILQKIDAESESPGEQLLEKAVSGKYLALYFNEKVRQSHQQIAPIATSQDLSELSHENHHDVAGDLARAIITRSAYLVAAAIAGAYEFFDKPEIFSLIGEGSLLWDGWDYHDNIKKKLTDLGIPKGTVNIRHIKDSSIEGAFGLITK
jgi:hexokinase